MPQDPAQIQRQIEDTRAELAHTIDAIADIVSPKRAAQRGLTQVRAHVEELRAQLTGQPQGADGQRQLPPGIAGELQNGTLYGTKRTVRWDRIALVGGGAVLLLVIVRRRRSH